VRDGPGGEIEQLEHAQIGTRLGEGLRESGSLGAAAMERTLAAVETFVARVRAHDAELSSIATSAMRRAHNAAEFSGRMRETTGTLLQVLDGSAEAQASFIGATYGVPHDGKRTAVVDVGGGSTEVAVGRDGCLERAHSIEIGSVRISERFGDLMGSAPGPHAHAAALAARAAIDTEIATFGAFGPVDRVRAVAGTATTIAAVASASDVDRVSGTVLAVATLEATIDRLLDLSLEERRALPGMLPQRADILAGGALVLAQTLDRLGAGEALIETNDLLLGYLITRSVFARDAGTIDPPDE
jgi:exopolyphosphatase/guanosine-5'-triphosphate,3'-diphosphate pyrophosphatase